MKGTNKKTNKKTSSAKPKRPKIDPAVHLAQVNEKKIYTEQYVLNPMRWAGYKSTTTLNWSQVHFAPGSRAKVPKKPGLYAFAVQPPHPDFPPASWLFYIGEVGATGSQARTLWQRYKEYLDELNETVRPKVGAYLNRYDGFVRFYFCELDPAVFDIKDIESSLITALWPEGNVNDFEASARAARRAFS